MIPTPVVLADSEGAGGDGSGDSVGASVGFKLGDDVGIHVGVDIGGIEGDAVGDGVAIICGVFINGLAVVVTKLLDRRNPVDTGGVADCAEWRKSSALKDESTPWGWGC